MANTSRLRKRREKLWLEDPRCRFCGIYTLLKSGEGIAQPEKDRLATIEHLDSRYNSGRGTHNGERTTLACWKCNNKRNQIEQELIPIDVKHERSRHND